MATTHSQIRAENVAKESFDSSDKTKSLNRESGIINALPLFPHGISLFDKVKEENAGFGRLNISRISR